jgi:hypothetical protein
MGAGTKYGCDKCGYSFETYGPWEFYRDAQGNIKPYGHPVPASVEAAESGIHGFMETKYCLACRKLVDILLVEFNAPRDYCSAWFGTSGLDTSVCPDCGGTDLLYYDLEDRTILCPKCNEGKLVITDYFKT